MGGIGLSSGTSPRSRRRTLSRAVLAALGCCGLLVPLGCAASPAVTPEPPASASSSPETPLGPDPTRTAAPGSTAPAPSPTPSGPVTPAAVPASCSTEVTRAELTACWRRILPAVSQVMAPMVTATGARWSAPRMAVFRTEPPANPCEGGDGGGVPGSFSCATDRTVYLSTFEAGAPTTDYVQEAKRVPGVLAADAAAAGVPEKTLRRGLTGQGQATILTHEMAHQVLAQSGYQRWFDVRADRYEPGSAKYDAYGFAPETAADCLTGAALHEAKRQGLLRMNAFDQWGSRAWLAQTDGFNRERPLGHPFRYRNEWKGEQYLGYGGAYWRLRAFDLGWRTDATSAVETCTTAAARWKGLSATPRPVR